MFLYYIDKYKNIIYNNDILMRKRVIYMNNEIIIELEKIKDGLRINLAKQLELKENIIEINKECEKLINGSFGFLKKILNKSKLNKLEQSVDKYEELLIKTKEFNKDLGEEYNKIVINLNKEEHYKEEDFINEMIDINSKNKELCNSGYTKKKSKVMN